METVLVRIQLNALPIESGASIIVFVDKKQYP